MYSDKASISKLHCTRVSSENLNPSRLKSSLSPFSPSITSVELKKIDGQFRAELENALHKNVLPKVKTLAGAGQKCILKAPLMVHRRGGD